MSRVLSRWSWLAAPCILGSFLLNGVASAQAPAAPPTQGAASTGVLVAVIDIGFILKNHARFIQQMDALKKEVATYEGDVSGERKRILGLRDQLASFKQGSLEYRKLEEDIARKISDTQIRNELKRKEVLEREAKIYLDTYNEIVAVVAEFADRNGIALVLRFNSKPIDPQDQRAVLEGVNRPIVYQRNLNITQIILDRINGTQARRP